MATTHQTPARRSGAPTRQAAQPPTRRTTARPTPADLQRRLGNRGMAAVLGKSPTAPTGTTPRSLEGSVSKVTPPSAAPADRTGAPAPAAAMAAQPSPEAASETAPTALTTAETVGPGRTAPAMPASSAEHPAPSQSVIAAPDAAPTPASEPTPSPDEAVAPAVQAVIQRASRAAVHTPAPTAVAAAQAAAKQPSTEQQRSAAENTMGQLDAAQQQTQDFDRASFRDTLRKAIDAAVRQPTTEDEAKEVIATGGQKASQAMQGTLTTQTHAATGPLQDPAAAEAGPDPTTAQPAVPLVTEPVGTPPEPVSPAPVVPAPLPPERLDYSGHRGTTDAAMVEAGLTNDQLARGNEPEFAQTLQARSEAETHEAQIAPTYRAEEDARRETATGQAQEALTGGLMSVHQARSAAIGTVAQQQAGTQTKDEAKRQRITETIDRIKNQTRADVEQILLGMETEASRLFGDGLAAAEKAYDQAFEEAKGDALTWLSNWGDAWRQHIATALRKARDEYLLQVDLAIDKVAECVDRNLAAAKKRVVDGQRAVKDYVEGLDASVRSFGEEALAKVSSEFSAMADTIDSRKNALIDNLTNQYKASYERMSAREEDLRNANKSLWDHVYETTVGLVSKILAFKDMLLGVLGKAADVIEDIIADPIRFLKNLVDGVMLGLKNFLANIGKHLQKGLMDWLFGALAGAGIPMPEKFDLKGIVSVVLQVLGLTYANFRARAVKIVGEPIVASLETAAEVFIILLHEGIPGLWRFIKDEVAELKSMVLDAIYDFIQEKVITAGITWIIGLLNPASAFFKACKAIYDIIMFFINRGSQILILVNAIIDSMGAIAKGSIGVAAKYVEDSLGKAVPVAIGFLAGLLGLGDISESIRKVIDKAKKPVNDAIDWVITKAVALVKKIGNALSVKSKKETGPQGVKSQAADRFVELAGEEISLREAERLAASVLAELKPLGLKTLGIRQDEDEAVYVLHGAASNDEDLTVLAQGLKRVIMHAKVQVSGEESPEVGTIRIPKFSRISTTTEAGKIAGTRNASLLQPAPAPPGMRVRDDRAYRPYGALALEPKPGSGVLEIVGWSTGKPIRGENTSHAEHQFRVWYQHESYEWRYRRVKGIDIKISHSPCSMCVEDLLKVGMISRGAELTISWDRQFTGKNSIPEGQAKRLLETHWVVNLSHPIGDEKDVKYRPRKTGKGR